MELDELHEGISHSLSKKQNFEGTRGLIGGVTTQTSERAALQRQAAASRIGSLATAGHHAADDLEEHFPKVAGYIHDAAAGCEHISSFLRDPKLDEMATFVGNLGQKQPAAAMAGVFLVAVGLSWFLIGSTDQSGSFAADDRERGTHGI
ncbi:MAG: hypothetical protein ACJ8AH_26575 [Stellaceae bacterium]|jgi:hypothetical protein